MNPEPASFELGARDLTAGCRPGGKRVERLLHDMGFGFVVSNFVLQDHPAPIVGEIDLVFECGGAMLLVEVGEGRHGISEKKRKFFEKWKAAWIWMS